MPSCNKKNAASQLGRNKKTLIPILSNKKKIKPPCLIDL